MPDFRGGEPGPPLGLYVHWPFCRAKCPYCDFNSHVRATIDQDRWRRALLRELDHFAAETGGRPLTSLFFGGGTPSLMAPATVAAVIETAARHWRFAEDVEISLEANPTSAEAASFAGFRAAGVNRVSLGIQALDDGALHFLGRTHGADEARRAIALARKHFTRVSCDLIYVRPGQRPEAWAAELQEVVHEGVGHLSAYQLTIEEGTAFHGAWRRGELTLPEEGDAARLYDLTQALLADAGLPAYEVSNHARPGEACRHNLTYWRYGDYVGIGPGAHGRLTVGGRKLALRQHRAPEAWLAGVEASGHATRTRTPLAQRARLEELLLMGLRLREGIARTAFVRELGAGPEAVLDAGRLRMLTDAGFLSLSARGLQTTETGLRRLDAVLRYLLTGTTGSVVAARACEAS